jgi:6-phosphogluconolactonase
MMKFKKSLMFSVVLQVMLVLLTAKDMAAQNDRNEIIYAGTSSRESKGLYVFKFDRAKGTLTELQAVNDGVNPNFMALSVDRRFLYVIYSRGSASDGNGIVTSYRVHPTTGHLTRLNEQSANGRGPAHVSVDPKGRFVYVSNYGDGSLAAYPINKDGSLAEASDVVKHSGSSIVVGRQEAPHVHSAIPSADGKYLYVSDLGVDKIYIYKVSGTGKLLPAEMPFAASTPGAGPRHFVIHPNQKFAYSAEEISSTLASFNLNNNNGALTPLERVQMIPSDFTERNSAADLHFSPDANFLYASNRGHETLGIYSVDGKSGKLKLLGYESTGGKHPRNFLVDKRGEFVFVANQNTGNVVVFRRDHKTGLLNRIGDDINIPGVVCLIQL